MIAIWQNPRNLLTIVTLVTRWYRDKSDNKCNMESAQSPPDWTFVTMFFSLEPYFKQRGVASHISHMAKTVYMERFKALVDLNVQLVVYTDSEGRDAMVPLLKDASKVRFIITPFQNLSFYKYIDQISDGRKGNSVYEGSRNIPEWAITVLSKFEAVTKAIEKDYFNSSMFCWIDFGFYRPDHDYVDYSVGELRRQLYDIQGNTFQPNELYVGVIDWVGRERSDDLDTFHKYGGPCTVSSQIFFGDKDVFAAILPIFVSTAEEHISKRVLHADEQVLFYVLLKNPHLFNLFPTDYFCAPMDILFPHKRYWVSIRLLVPNLLKDGRLNIAKHVIRQLLKSHDHNKIKLDSHVVNMYRRILCE